MVLARLFGGACTPIQMGGSVQGCPLALSNQTSTIGGDLPGMTNFGDADAAGNSSRFFSPRGITSDGTSLYIADTTNNKIRRMVIATGVVTTIGGPAPGLTTSGDTDAVGNASRFNAPQGVTTDGTNLYVADTGNNKIRKIVIASGVVTTIGGPAPGLTTSGDTDATGKCFAISGPHRDHNRRNKSLHRGLR